MAGRCRGYQPASDLSRQVRWSGRRHPVPDSRAAPRPRPQRVTRGVPVDLHGEVIPRWDVAPRTPRARQPVPSAHRASRPAASRDDPRRRRGRLLAGAHQPPVTDAHGGSELRSGAGDRSGCTSHQEPESPRRRGSARPIESPPNAAARSRRARAETHSASVAHQTKTSGSRSDSIITAPLDGSFTRSGTMAELSQNLTVRIAVRR